MVNVIGLKPFTKYSARAGNARVFSSRMGRYTGIDMYFGIDFLLWDDDNCRKIRKFVC